MRLSFDVSDQEMSEADQRMIRQELGLHDDVTLQDVLGRISKCAFLEYRKMLIERGLPTKAAEVMQERLYYLIRGYYVGALPQEQQIATIFQLTSSGAKTLLRNTISRYRVNLQAQVRESIRRLLQTAREEDDRFLLVVQSETVKDEINKYLTQNAPTLTRLLAVKGSAGQYYCPEDTMNFLNGEFGVHDGRRTHRS